MQYALTLDDAFAQSGLRDNRALVVKTGAFSVTECTVNELASEVGPDMVELEGRLVFNGAVNPEAFCPP